MMMGCEVAEGERRDSFIYPLVFIFCFEKRAELGGARLGGGEARRKMGEVDLEDEASEAAGSLGAPLPYCKRQAVEPDEYMITPWLSARRS